MYHVFARGTGQRIIFEDDGDRLEYCRRMEFLRSDLRCDVYAWCLMGNHVHLLVHAPMERLAMFVKRLDGGYARFFNERHGRIGHLFEGRYGSEPIDSDQQLLAAVRYIHRNPIKPGLSEDCDYPWSSYREYLGAQRIVDKEFVLQLVGGIDSFVAFHMECGDETFLDVGNEKARVPCRMTHDEAIVRARELLGNEGFEMLPSLERDRRDDCLRTLKQAGMSVRQIELITGVGRGIIQKAVRGMPI